MLGWRVRGPVLVDGEIRVARGVPEPVQESPRQGTARVAHQNRSGPCPTAAKWAIEKPHSTGPGKESSSRLIGCVMCPTQRTKKSRAGAAPPDAFDIETTLVDHVREPARANHAGDHILSVGFPTHSRPARRRRAAGTLVDLRWFLIWRVPADSGGTLSCPVTRLEALAVSPGSSPGLVRLRAPASVWHGKRRERFASRPQRPGDFGAGAARGSAVGWALPTQRAKIPTSLQKPCSGPHNKKPR
jgi:hypothetical protein